MQEFNKLIIAFQMLKYKSEHYLGKEMTFKLKTNNSKIYLKFFF